MQKIILICFLIFSVLPTFFHSDFGCTSYGYSFLWLAILYIAGAYIKKYCISFDRKNKSNLYGYFICVIITWLSKIVIEYLTQLIFDEPRGGNYLISYTSPTIILCLVFLLLFFANIKCNRTVVRFIFFAPVFFGVYLFHGEPLIKDAFIDNAFVHYLSFNPLIRAPAVIAIAFCIWLVSSLVDRIRLIIFDNLKIRQFCTFVEGKLSTFVNTLLQQ